VTNKIKLHFKLLNIILTIISDFKPINKKTTSQACRLHQKAHVFMRSSEMPHAKSESFARAPVRRRKKFRQTQHAPAHLEEFTIFTNMQLATTMWAGALARSVRQPNDGLAAVIASVLSHANLLSTRKHKCLLDAQASGRRDKSSIL
jgi:hypothetical protein